MNSGQLLNPLFQNVLQNIIVECEHVLTDVNNNFLTFAFCCITFIPEMKNLRIHISGKVYKVGFRYYLKQMAFVNHISGYVKYDSNHSLLLEAQGNEKNLDKFVKYCMLGCINSNVQEVSLKDLPEKYYSTFEIKEN